MFLKVSCLIVVFLMCFALNCFGQSVTIEGGGRIHIEGGGRPQTPNPPPSQNQTRGTTINGVEFYAAEFTMVGPNNVNRRVTGTVFINHNNYSVRVVLVGGPWLDLAPREEKRLGTWDFQMVNTSEIRVNRR